MPIFDVVIGNPPYKGKLYQKFLLDAINMSNEYVVFVHPGMIYLNKQPTNRTNIEKKLVPILDNYINDIEIFNAVQYFKDIKLLAPMAISFIDKKNKADKIILTNKVENKSYEYSSIKDIHIKGNSDTFLSLREKILTFCRDNDNIKDHIGDNGNYYVNIAEVRGNLSFDDPKKWVKNDFYTLIPKESNISNNPRGVSFGFSIENEANNFLNYIKTDFARFGLSIFKISLQQSGWELYGIPWLDFSKEWTDEKLYKKFNLSTEEINFIQENIPKYY